MYKYDDNFYLYINRGAVDSARVLIPALLDVLPNPVTCVLDVGCGAGAWLSVWKSHGAKVLGLDGDYLNADSLLIEHNEFQAMDLSMPFSTGDQFSLVQSLEVAEHLPQSTAPEFVRSLCSHSDMVLFSAATPGQGGENHINEQSFEYWRRLFKEQGYSMYDPVRHRVIEQRAVKPWYRYNTFLYVSDQADSAILAALSPFRLEPGQPVKDMAPLAYRLRKQIIKLLPDAVSTRIAIIKKTLFRLLLKIGLPWG